MVILYNPFCDVHLIDLGDLSVSTYSSSVLHRVLYMDTIGDMENSLLVLLAGRIIKVTEGRLTGENKVLIQEHMGTSHSKNIPKIGRQDKEYMSF